MSEPFPLPPRDSRDNPMDVPTVLVGFPQDGPPTYWECKVCMATPDEEGLGEYRDKTTEEGYEAPESDDEEEGDDEDEDDGVQVTIGEIRPTVPFSQVTVIFDLSR